VSTVATIHSDALPPGERGAAVQLVVVEGPDAGRAARLEDACVVGTDSGCELVLTDDRVSRRHLELRRIEGRFALRDLDSRNGTFYEGSRIREASVGVGATLKLGRSFLRIAPLPQPVDVPPSQARRFGELVGESLTMREVFAVLELAAQSDVTVLLEGETGVGKELAARGVHEASARRRGPFVALDCSALPPTLVESELFGHVRGAFTGASRGREGAFARADGGTLFLDELDSVPEAVQARLLRAVEERSVRPVGSDRDRDVDVRLVAASRRDLSALVADGTFRADLFYRLSVIRVRIPPLRERREDIAPIVAELLRRRGMSAPGAVEGRNLELLFAHDWPGNVRELRNAVDRALALSPGAACFAELRVRLDDPRAPEDGLSVRADLPFHEAKQEVVDAFERRYLADLLARHGGNLSAAARDAGLDRKHLRRLARRHGLLGSTPE
jgi:DNA-binding NtrC family response regulator